MAQPIIPKTTRRNLLLVGLGMMMACETAKTQPKSPNIISKTIPQRILGKTGLSLPILGLGGAGQTPLSQWGQEKASIALINAAFPLGIRYFDTAANYGPSEDYLGKALPSVRSQVIILSLEGVQGGIIAAEHIPQLESNIKVAQNYHPLDPIAMQKITEKTAQTWQETTFFRHWT